MPGDFAAAAEDEGCGWGHCGVIVVVVVEGMREFNPVPFVV